MFVHFSGEKPRGKIALFEYHSPWRSFAEVKRNEAGFFVCFTFLEGFDRIASSRDQDDGGDNLHEEILLRALPFVNQSRNRGNWETLSGSELRHLLLSLIKSS